jgi:NTE family protein
MASASGNAVVQRRLVVGAGLGVALLGGCAFSPDEDHSGPDAPREQPLARPLGTAWVFSSGGPRGFVHVGVVKALSELGLAPDLLVGASIGALVAVVYASGMPARDIERLALEVQPLSLGRLAVGGSERFSGNPIADMVRAETGALPLERLRIPVACVAASRADGRLAAFTAGDAGLAVQASCAIEGQFSPVRIRGVPYVDADQYQPLPVRLARRLGAARVLAVDASAHEDKAPPSAARYREGDLRKRAVTEPDTRAANLALHPDFGYYVSLSRDFRERAIEAGYRATLAQAAMLRTLHTPT